MEDRLCHISGGLGAMLCGLGVDRSLYAGNRVELHTCYESYPFAYHVSQLVTFGTYELILILILSQA